MDAKTKVNFINSIKAVKEKKEMACPKCGAMNEAESIYCMSCGSPIKQDTDVVSEQDDLKVNEYTIEKKEKEIVYEEPNNIFAEGLPSWSIEPPHLVVRRKRR